ncbi:hypothetical protein WR25_11825 [Diploscapter pachys]|uniref:Protein HGH1 C-terminal domain-containing protein n=1 Tax=Diploscapter pachys TaxID=2018661 RepID=A0A2A2KLU5_9BILA|nr:hypothetical protein WR25_11825 [Diploscapter pachys]
MKYSYGSGTWKFEEGKPTVTNFARILFDLHPKLLDQDDAFLCALVAPLLDESAKFDDDEMAKLPLRLQYFEGKREQNQEIRQAIIEALYQLCATKFGRESLRSKGIYPALRELDKSQQAVDRNEQEKQDDKPKMQAIGVLGGEEEHTLHALIGILIRYESEMDIDPNLDTIRSLS